MSDPLLRIRDLSVSFETRHGIARAVDGVSLDLGASETLALVGESGSGKSMTALSILGLLPPGARVAEDSEVRLRGENLIDAPMERLRSVRGQDIAMVFQEPMTSLNPVLRVGTQIVEAVRAHGSVSRRVAAETAVALLDRVGFQSPAAAADAWPHELSGGMRQRAMIAMAIACAPSVLIADEPTTALDVTVQARILELLATLRADAGLSMLLITHDLAVASQVADRVAVMYGGRIVEEGPTASLMTAPRHPYTEALIASVPPMDRSVDRLPAIPGAVPRPTEWPSGCRFHPRCPAVLDRCASEEPPLEAGLRCWLDR